jgi:hypothetical protein
MELNSKKVEIEIREVVCVFLDEFKVNARMYHALYRLYVVCSRCGSRGRVGVS